MIIVKENDRIYIAESTYITTKDGQKESGCLLENMPIFKVSGGTTLIAGAGDRWQSDLDRLRYLHLSFPKTLTVPAIHKKLPMIADSIDAIGGLKNGKIQTDLVFAKGDRAFFLTNGTTFKEIETLETIGWRSTEYRYAMMVNNNLPVVDRIVSAFRLVEKYSGAKLFPIMIWDTKSGKSAIIEEEGKK